MSPTRGQRVFVSKWVFVEYRVSEEVVSEIIGDTFSTNSRPHANYVWNVDAFSSYARALEDAKNRVRSKKQGLLADIRNLENLEVSLV